MTAKVEKSPAPHLEAFLAAANYFVGLEENPDDSNRFTDPRGAEMLSLAGEPYYHDAWCAVLVSACAAKAGIDWVLIAPGTGVGGVTSNTVDWYNAEWIDGPYLNGGIGVTPIPGDLISFAYHGPAYSGYEHGSHIGIVEYVDDEGVHTIEGNSANMCAKRTYALDYGSINGYCRPDWAQVGDNISSYLANAGLYSNGPLYQNKNDRHDMVMREVGYLDKDYNLSNKPSGIGLSVINYTTFLGSLYDLFAPSMLSTSTEPIIDTSQLTGNLKIAMDYLLRAGYSASAASGVCACLQIYSKIDPSYYSHRADNACFRGICAWEQKRFNELKRRLGYDWGKNLSGQLSYMTEDLNTSFNGLVQAIKFSDLDNENTEDCAQTFMALYNKEFDTIKNKNQARKYASDIYNKLIITMPVMCGTVDDLRDENGKQLTAQFSVTIPDSVPQTGIIDDFTSYSHWYHLWNSHSPQRQLADIWAYQGCPASKGVATIGGYYCIAVRPKFGSCGDVLVVTLEGGDSFAGIICDEKDDDAGSEWGHDKGYGISIIEWERIVTFEGKVQTEGGSYLVDGHDFDDWLRKKVLTITNYGKYSDVRWI